MIIPEVQYPHCIAPASRNACLHGMELFAVGEAFNRRDLLLRNRSDPGDARSLRFSVNQDGAGAALALAAAVLASRQIKMIAQDGKKAGLRVGINRVGTSIDRKSNRSH